MRKQIVGWSLVSVVLFLLFAFTMHSAAYGADKPITFQWEQAVVDLPTLEKWTLYYAIASGGPYVFLANIPYASQPEPYQSTQTVSIVGDGEERNIYFVLTATDTDDNESGYSNEIYEWIDFKAPGNPFTFTIILTPIPE